MPANLKVQEHTEVDGYDIWGWRYVDDETWHIKVWPKVADVRENVYTITVKLDGGTSGTASDAERRAILKAIGGWSYGLTSSEPS